MVCFLHAGDPIQPFSTHTVQCRLWTVIPTSSRSPVTRIIEPKYEQSVSVNTYPKYEQSVSW
eukprot:6399110-Prymnesium_polylepis.2